MELFPDDVLISILARLPVKSLIRFTSVCKHWQSMIKSPEFVCQHYATRLSINEDGYDSILTQYTPACSFTVFSYETLNCETAFKIRPAVLFDPPMLGVYHRDVITGIEISSHCNGIFFLILSRFVPAPAPPPFETKSELVLLLWNPAIRQVYKLPNLDDIYKYGYFGLGFDSATNDYKVVCFGGVDPSCIGGRVRKVVAIYSLAANRWRRLDAEEKMNMIGYGGESISQGNYRLHHISTGRKSHWILTDSDHRPMNRPQRINFLLSFDMVDEVFVQTRLPYHYDERNGKIAYLDQGSKSMNPVLCILDKQSKSEPLTIWVLKEYGPRGYWSKQYSVAIPLLGSFMMLRNNSSSIVFYSNRQVNCYDLVTRRIEFLYFPADAGLLAYTESLVSVLPPAHRSHQPPPPPPNTDDRDEEEEDEEHDNDDDSIDSAFLEPAEESFMGSPPRCTDYEAWRIDYSHKRREWLKLVKLPYCVCELYQPINSNTCTF